MLYPSVLSYNFNNIAEQNSLLESAGFTTIHCDVMDGHFVPNLTFGADFFASLNTKMSMDCHLMVKSPENFVESFKKLPLECITFHVEATHNPHRLAQYLKTFGCKVGVSLNPATHESNILHLLDVVDRILVMTVNPGFGGQKFIPTQCQKIAAISQMITSSSRKIDLQVDGGINEETLPIVKKAGANVFVAGSDVFSCFEQANPKQALIAKRKLYES